MVSVVVVNWNGQDYLPACLDAIYAQVPAPEAAGAPESSSKAEAEPEAREPAPARTFVLTERGASTPRVILYAGQESRGNPELESLLTPLLGSYAERESVDGSYALEPELLADAGFGLPTEPLWLLGPEGPCRARGRPTMGP